MDLNYILENEELNKLLNNCIGKTYNKFHLSIIMELNDFKQETYIYIINRVKAFDKEKSSFKTYLPMIVMSAARELIRKANGQCKNHNKLEFKNNTISLDNELENAENRKSRIDELTGVENDISFVKALINEILSLETLSKKQKQVIYLLSKGNSISDIAEILNKTPSCINITFQRAKEKIVKKYSY